MGKYTLIDLVQIILYITYTINTIFAYKNYSKRPINISIISRDVTCPRSKVVGFLRITRFIATTLDIIASQIQIYQCKLYK